VTITPPDKRRSRHQETVVVCSICGSLFDTVFGCGQNHDAWVRVPVDPVTDRPVIPPRP
jgi:hypothetical protein